MLEIETLATGLTFPEGPVALADGSVLLVELRAANLVRVWPDRTRTVVAHLGGSPNGAALGPDGKCYIANNGGLKWADTEHGMHPAGASDDYAGGRIERVDLDSGSVETVYTRCGDHALKGPNDLVFDRHGGFWFTDSGKTFARTMDRGGVYYATPDGGSIREVIYPMFQANGIQLSRDGRTLYVSETEPGRVWAFEVTAPGAVAKRPLPSLNGGWLHAGLPGFQRLDGLAIDPRGLVCAATLMNGGVSVIHEDGAVEHFKMPDLWATNLCFSADGRTLYVTLGGTGRLVSTAWPPREPGNRSIGTRIGTEELTPRR